jgi:uncharacterized membrane protein YphA (DoxX/SURF4 family)
LDKNELHGYPGESPWPAWQKVIFRFLFVYFLLFIQPWTWIDYIPYAGQLLKYYFPFKSWMVNGANEYFFQTYDPLVSPNGSGDTSFAWTELKLNLVLAALSCVIWSILRHKAADHNMAAYWFRQTLRFHLIINCFLYGIDKTFSNQMPFPSLSQMATPLGDLLPMRLSWIFLGYSGPYQSFLGIVEVVAGLLLFFRRTTTLGALLAVGIFAQVAMMNLAYDIPVKIFSIHLFIMALILVVFERKRLFSFFIANTNSSPSKLYEVRFFSRWMRIGRWMFKYAFIGLCSILYFLDVYSYSRESKNRKGAESGLAGMFDVSVFAINKDTLPPLINDSVRWKDIVFESGIGSVNSTDTIFWQRYRRGYFRYTSDSALQLIHFTKRDWSGRTDSLFSLKYTIPDSSAIYLRGKIRNDSVYIELKKSNRHFQLAEKQFHWLSDYNR